LRGVAFEIKEIQIAIVIVSKVVSGGRPESWSKWVVREKKGK
jgi:hypothetical protein